jgi:hypothetical protein
MSTVRPVMSVMRVLPLSHAETTISAPGPQGGT